MNLHWLVGELLVGELLHCRVGECDYLRLLNNHQFPLCLLILFQGVDEAPTCFGTLPRYFRFDMSVITSLHCWDLMKPEVSPSS